MVFGSFWDHPQTADLAASFLLSAWPSCFLNWIMVSWAWHRDNDWNSLDDWHKKMNKYSSTFHHVLGMAAILRKKRTGQFWTPSVKKAMLKVHFFQPHGNVSNLCFLRVQIRQMGRPLANPHDFASFLHQVTAQQHFVGSVLVILRP